MDPITSIAIISGATGAVAGKLIEKAWEAGEKWIKEYYKSHAPKAQQKAKENALSFLSKVAEAVKIIQESSRKDPLTIEIIENSFKDPDFSAILQTAIITSSRTSSDDKHKILARLISERLLSQAEDMVSLASSVAVEAIGNLKAKHLYALGLAILVERIRPIDIPKDQPQEKLNQIAYEFWIENLTPLINKIEDLTYIDIQHLVAVNCIDYQSIVGKNLIKILKFGFGEWDVQKFLTETGEGKKLKEYHGKYLQHMTLTSAGQLIGTYVKDLVTGMRTKIEW